MTDRVRVHARTTQHAHTLSFVRLTRVVGMMEQAAKFVLHYHGRAVALFFQPVQLDLRERLHRVGVVVSVASDTDEAVRVALTHSKL